jgi:hypothetical protein
MWLRGGINYEPRIGTVWNVPTHGKFWRALQHHLKAGQGNLRNSDTAPGAIAGGHFQIIRSDGPLLVLENLERFKRGAEKNSQRPPSKDIVCKRKDSPYKVTEKPSRHWIKVKNSRYSQLEGREELFERT